VDRFLVALVLLANSVFYIVWADDKHKEKMWYQKLFDMDDDDYVSIPR